MTTTAIVVEMLIIGLFAALWVVLCLLKFLPLSLHSLVSGLDKAHDWSNGIIVVSTIAAYQLGWLVNALCAGFVELTLATRVRDEKIYGAAGLTYDAVRAKVYQNASPQMHADLLLDRSVTRLARAGVLNFALICLASGGYGIDFCGARGLLLLLSVGCGVQWYFRYKRYHKRMLTAYGEISSKPVPEGTATPGASP